MNKYTIESIIQWIIFLAILVLIAEFINPKLGIITFVVLRIFTRIKREKNKQL